MTSSSGRGPYGAGFAIAGLASLLIVWSSIVRDDGSGMSFFMVIMAAAVGAFSARFEPAGMARAMIGVALMQVLLGIGNATAPSTAVLRDGPIKALLFSGAFAGMWLISAAFFRRASTSRTKRPQL